MREVEEAWTKVRIVLEFGHVQLDVGGWDASFESGKDHLLFGVDRAAWGTIVVLIAALIAAVLFCRWLAKRMSRPASTGITIAAGIASLLDLLAGCFLIRTIRRSFQKISGACGVYVSIAVAESAMAEPAQSCSSVEDGNGRRSEPASLGGSVRLQQFSFATR